MGRSKHKDKRKSGHRSAVNDDEERRKMRESILKIFHQRAMSPEGAVLVNDTSVNKPVSTSKTRSLNERKVVQMGHERDQNEISPETISSSDSGNDGQISSRKRKRQKKVMTGQESHKHQKSAVSSHVKAVRSYATKDTENREGGVLDIGAHITRSRLTRGLGLFNPGKKSKTVCRDPLPAPPHLQEEVEKAMKKILAKDDDNDIWSHQYHADVGAEQFDYAGEHREVKSHSGSKPSTITPASAECDHMIKTRKSVYSFTSSSATNPESKPVPDAVSSPDSASESFSKVLEYHNVADNLLSYLDAQSKKAFGDRDLLTETCSDLKKMLLQNKITPELNGVGSQNGVQKQKRDVISTSINHQRPHSVELPAHQAQSYSANIYKRALSSDHLFRPVSPSRSWHSGSRSTIDPTQIGLAVDPVSQQIDFRSKDLTLGTHHDTDLSRFSLLGTCGFDGFSSANRSATAVPGASSTGAASYTAGTFSNTFSNVSNHQSLATNSERATNSQSNSRTSFAESFHQPLRLFSSFDGVGESRTSSSRERILRKGGDYDMTLDPQLSVNPDMSTLDLLQANHFMARLSTMCGEPEQVSSPQSSIPQLGLQNFVHVTSEAGSSADHLSSYLRRDMMTTFQRGDNVDNAESDLLLGTVTGLAPTHTCSARDFHTMEYEQHSQDLMNGYSHHGQPVDNDVSFCTHPDLLDQLDLYMHVDDPDPPHITTDHHSSHYAASYPHSPPSNHLSLSTLHPSLPRHPDSCCHLSQGCHDVSCHLPRQNGDDSELTWGRGLDNVADFLPALRKPSLNTPSPPRKLSPHLLL